MHPLAAPSPPPPLLSGARRERFSPARATLDAMAEPGTVRSIRADELDDLLELYAMLDPANATLEPEDVRDQWDSIRADESVDVVVVEYDGRLVASCLCSITPNLTHGGRPFAVIENVVTHEEFRSQGFGSRCLEAAVERAAERDCYKVMLLTGTVREWTLAFYEDCGFERDAKTGFVRWLEDRDDEARE